MSNILINMLVPSQVFQQEIYLFFVSTLHSVCIFFSCCLPSLWWSSAITGHSEELQLHLSGYSVNTGHYYMYLY